MSSEYAVSSEGEEKKPLLSRREFFIAALVGLLSIPAAARFLTVLGSFVSVPERSYTGSVIPNWVPAGLIKDLTEKPRTINFGEDIVYVMKTKKGTQRHIRASVRMRDVLFPSTRKRAYSSVRVTAVTSI